MRPEDALVASQVLKVVHDDGDEQVEKQKHGQKDEGDEERDGEEAAAAAGRRDGRPRVALGVNASEHNLLPILAGGAAEKQQQTDWEVWMF